MYQLEGEPREWTPEDIATVREWFAWAVATIPPLCLAPECPCACHVAPPAEEAP